jgi:ABC-type uncharacterized transport system involved in gliding motility auxiliary subunit
MNIAKFGKWGFVASIFLNLIIWGYIPSLGAFSYTYLILWGLCAVSLVAWVIFSLHHIRKFLLQRSSQFAIGLTLTALLVLSLLGVVNWVAYTYNKKWDLTQNKLYSLSEQSLNAVSNIKDKVTVRVWTSDIESMGGATNLKKFLDNYKIHSRGKVEVEILNPNDHVLKANSDKVTKSNIMVVRSESGRESRIEVFNEAKAEELITNAIIETQKKDGGKKLVCFLTGHGEPSITDNTQIGLSNAKERIESAGYEAKEISLANATSFPQECETLGIVGPKSQALDQEKKLIEDYLGKGGRVLALFGLSTHESWNEILKPYGVAFNKDLIIRRENPGNPISIVTQDYAEDVAVVAGFRMPVSFAETQTLKVPATTEFEGAQVRPFISSAKTDFAKSNPMNNRNLGRFEPGDKWGPHSLAVLITKKVSTPDQKPLPKSSSLKRSKIWESIFPIANAQGLPPELSGEALPESAPTESGPETQMIVYSNHTFAYNVFLYQAGNLDLFLNSISFLLKEKDQISIRPRVQGKVSLQLTPNSHKQVLATLLLLIVTIGLGWIWSLTRKSEPLTKA